jgi:RimJ/RimL family protein N-acetyltransferase
LRPLVEADVGQSYLDWFSDPEVIRFIEAARVPQSIESLRCFIRVRQGRADVWFHGIFVGKDAKLVGTIKCEPIDSKAGVAVMGILIGELGWRGAGLAGEVISAVAAALRNRAGIARLELGVHPDNNRAVRAYERIGFKVVSRSPNALWMRLQAEGGSDGAS